jgi:hypothetical protein
VRPQYPLFNSTSLVDPDLQLLFPEHGDCQSQPPMMIETKVRGNLYNVCYCLMASKVFTLDSSGSIPARPPLIQHDFAECRCMSTCIHAPMLNSGAGTDDETSSVYSSNSIVPQQATASDIANLIAQVRGDIDFHVAVSSPAQSGPDESELTDPESKGPGLQREDDHFGANTVLTVGSESSNVNSTKVDLSSSQ